LGRRPPGSDRARQSRPAALREAGIELSHWGTAEEGVELNYFAADRETAHRFLGERYPPHVRLNWIGPARMAEEPQPFGSWVIDGTQLTVFYPLPANEERPGSCTVEEYPDRVVVSLSILAPQGMNTTIGGFTPSHATVDLKEPLGRRTVIDAAHDLPRPQWTGG
jgi:hypothetical protein